MTYRMDDIEKLLSDEEGKDVETTETTVSETSAEEKSDGKGKKDEVTVLKRELARRQKEIELLKKPKEEPKAEADADPLGTREGWLAEIDKRAEAKADAKFSALKEANLRKARDRFIAQHPEYAGDAGKTKLRTVLERANALGLTSKLDEGEMTEVILDAWAIENRKELEVVAEDRRKQRERAQKAASQAAGTGGASEKIEDDFTETERETASKYGMTPERYRKAERRLAEANYSLN